MEQQNTTPDGGASTPNPIDRIQAFLAAEDGDSTGQTDDAGDGDADPKNAANNPDDPQDGVPGKDGEPQITTAHLAQFLGIEESEIDVDDSGQPVFKTKINGKEGTAKFQDFLKDYQLRGHAENLTHEAAKLEKAAERKLQEADQVIQAKYAEQHEAHRQVASLALAMQQELQTERQSYNWDSIWSADPAQARALERRLDEKQQRINGVMQQIAMRDQHVRANAEAQRKANEEKAANAQAERLLKLIPEWKDQAVYAKERQELLSWLEKSGFDPDEVDLSKASQVHLLRKTWQHDTLQKAKPAIENKVRTAPKLVKPGTTPQAETGNTAELKNLKHQVKQTGSSGTKALEAWLLKSGKA